ncbi:hypothetical protein [Nocardioides limicola]|uniref:hypothetical protein n=1 Tax=Nocardioides limicola TaxID=2803368 RepID=UPI00193B8494|nr:hypothetical protein [Nocardioides sp. DJM-14]
MSKRVILHVGTPKTGTSYAQDVLFRNQRILAGRGISYPADRHDAHFLAALDLMGLTWGGLEAEAVGAWDALASRVRSWSGTTIISHEILAHASRGQVARALESFGETEVHLVISVRDLVRQIPAEWQENVKHRAVVGYQQFLEQLRDPRRDSRIAAWFWAVQDVPDILDRWGSGLPPERVHVVTVPPKGAPRGELWQRFITAFGLAEVNLDLGEERANVSLGVPETVLLRRINQQVNPVLAPPDYRPLVRELLAHQTWSKRTDSPRLALPPDAHAWAAGLCADWARVLAERGYDVIGSLDDLTPAAAGDFTAPEEVLERDVSDAGVDAIQALLIEAARLRRREEELLGELAESHAALQRSYLRPSYRFRERLVRMLDRSNTGQRLLGAYRGLRGRNSRSA